MARLARLLVFLILVALAAAQSTHQLPTTEGENLTGSKVVLPDAAKGKLAVLIFGFSKASKTANSAWADKIFAEFGTQSGFTLYQLPVLENVPGFVRGMAISSMKKGVRDNMREHFIPVLHGESELKKLVGYKEADDAYLVMLDPTGQIVKQMHGPFSDAACAQLRTDIQSQLNLQK